MLEKIIFSQESLIIPVPIDEIFDHNFDNNYKVYYKKKRKSLLNSLCDQFGSDKGEETGILQPYPWPSHTYADFIERHFDHCRQYIKNVFECGLGTNNPTLASNMTAQGKPGASLRVWREYFPSANIYGADIDKEILFEESNIKTFYCDQTSKESIDNLWNQIGDVKFDLMIDDGLHTFNAGVSLFENSFHKLREGGIYIIEDVNINDLILYKKYFLGGNYNYDFVNLYRKSSRLNDNSLIMIRNV